MKRTVFAAAAITICFALSAFGSVAYFTADDVAHNVITSGEVNIEVLEWADADKTTAFPTGGVSGVMPGTAVTKIVEVENTGSADAYVRVKVGKSIVPAAPAAPATAAPSTDVLLIDINVTDWTQGTDGFYYYNEPLAPGEVTVPLFTSVTFAADMGNEYQESTATVTVSAYAVQVANNGADVFSAVGWPEV